MAQGVQVTGPVGMFVNIGDTEPQLIGTCQIRPRIQWRRQWEPVFNDLGGLVPFDMQYMGMDALVIADINRHDPGVVTALRSLPSMNPSKFGQEELGDIGSLMIQEGLAAELILAFPYPSVKGVALTNGISFKAAWLIDDSEEDGTRHQINRFGFYCLRDFDPEVLKFTLCDFNVPAGLFSSAA